MVVRYWRSLVLAFLPSPPFETSPPSFALPLCLDDIFVESERLVAYKVGVISKQKTTSAIVHIE